MKTVFLLLFLFFQSDIVLSQVVSGVSLLQHRSYMLRVIEETVKDLEEFEWCNLKVPDFTEDVDFEFFNNRVTGTFAFKNGFVTSVQHVDVVESTLQQVWSWDSSTSSGVVEIRGQLRLHDLTLGFDVEAHLDEEIRRYTSTFTHRLISFNFVVRKNINTEEMIVTVTGVHPASTNKMMFKPEDRYTDLMRATYDPNSTRNAIMSWATNILQPLAENVATKRVEFPTICYNCAA